ncbi:hypothetical protein PENANT_c035G06951 [Penicillium antarcticum]|uniref:Metallo-beta-lactamase domain-containing protein n=1 Tax=Penicillium antarcticum TaxID=416450 RepID=A0A1V6PTW8_9EURO|nr:uncharacterized protein N7508_009915 [Penicillium antarcticum]KAJ5295094.1 hypothetical protein N7508_009915 [Penicillium antarcticum]OQD80464.1 hypothetical protein PENANT_c035G06951 [Penicillium antarcticum]
MEPIIHSIIDKETGTWQYIVACPNSRNAVIIDPVLNLEPTQPKIMTSSADSLLDVVSSHNYTVVRLLETHAHADHLTAAYYLQRRLLVLQQCKVPICTGYRIKQVQDFFAAIYNVPKTDLDGAFDHLFQDDEIFSIGNLTAQVLHLPGHTPDHSGFLIGSNIFTGDSIFNPDVGSARCDFPKGDPNALFQSMHKLLCMPSHYNLYTGHDYPPEDSGRDPMPYVTVAEQRERNKHVKGGTKQEEFVAWRRARDSVLKNPRLLHQALQVNIRGGRLPRGPGNSQTSFFLTPVEIPSLLTEV